MYSRAQALARAEGLDGWMNAEELNWLWDHARLALRIVEVGCWQGLSTTMLALGTPGVVVAVDHFCGPDDPGDTLYDEAHRLGPTALERKFRQNTDGLGNVIMLPVESTQAAAFFGTGTVDFVFIDGTHTYEAVRADLLAWRRVLRPGGLLAGHDGDMPGVARACAEVLGPVQRAIPGCSIWWVICGE